MERQYDNDERSGYAVVFVLRYEYDIYQSRDPTLALTLLRSRFTEICELCSEDEIRKITETIGKWFQRLYQGMYHTHRQHGNARNFIVDGSYLVKEYEKTKKYICSDVCLAKKMESNILYELLSTTAHSVEHLNVMLPTLALSVSL